jgi:branched-chain amino acid transport system substrate-binding protein
MLGKGFFAGCVVCAVAGALQAEWIQPCIDARGYDDTIKLGMSTALSGPNQYLGLAMKAGVLARLSEANCSTAWTQTNPSISLTVLDDSYQPLAAENNTRRLIEEKKVVAMIGNVGTPTARRAWVVANDAQVVFYGAYSGSNILRRKFPLPPIPYVFNYRASYEQEMEIIVDAIIRQGIPLKRIGFFLQDDDFGASGFDAAKVALEKRGFRYAQTLARTHYPRNSLSIQPALESFIAAEEKPEAIVIVGGYKPSAEFIRFAHRLLPKTRFYNLSFPGASELSRLLPDIDSRVYITQVIPQATAAEEHHSNEVRREGYLLADTLVQAIEKISADIAGRTSPGDISSEALKLALEAFEQDINQSQSAASVAPIDHQMMDKVWLAELKKGGQWKSVN